jgi:hypothetical protein
MKLTADQPATAPPPPRPILLARFGMGLFYALTILVMVAALAVAANNFGILGTPTTAIGSTPAPLATAVIRDPTPPALPQQPVSVAAPVVTSAPIIIVETATPPEPTSVPLPTADLANVSAVDDIANAVDRASGGNPGAATPVPAGAELPTAIIGPVDPSGGDAALMARACANSGAGAACSAPPVAIDEQAIACAVDQAAGGLSCTPVAEVAK